MLAWLAPKRDQHTYSMRMLVGEVETSEMAANSVKESLSSLPDEPDSLDYFPFFKRSIGKPKKWSQKPSQSI